MSFIDSLATTSISSTHLFLGSRIQKFKRKCMTKHSKSVPTTNTIVIIQGRVA